MKRIISAILAAAVFITLFCSCAKNSPKKESKYNTLYFKDSSKSQKAAATFFNSANGKKKTVNMKKISTDKNSCTFSCKGDTSAYNMAYVTYEKKKTDSFTFNKCTSGWHKTKNNLFPYTQGKKDCYKPKYDVLKFKYQDYEKKVYVWKPVDYDAKSPEKYSTVYTLDAYLMMYIKEAERSFRACPVVTEQVNAMNTVTGRNAIVVGIDTSFRRDSDLTPDIGELRFENSFDEMEGKKFASFIKNKVMPYINKHYNVYTDARHNSIAGASLGGMEAFYIGMEYPETFGTVGALSPSFWAFKDSAWVKYLSGKKFSNKSPFLYLYSGNYDLDVGPFVKTMYNNLIKKGYPKNKVVYHYIEENEHNTYCWRLMFSEFLTAAAYGKIEPLQKNK